MRDRIEQTGENFWTIRGSFKIGGLIDIGTQAALVRRPSGQFVLLDSYTLSGAVKDEVMALTDQGAAVEAVLNLHPFHTVHCAQMHADFPKARHIGSERHVMRFSDLNWDAARIDDPALQAEFADTLEFSVPRGVDFISRNENVHFSSVLAYHPASKTLHSDDTLMVIGPARKLPVIGMAQRLSFHPTLGQALEHREGAADEFDAWAQELATLWGEAETICAAHLTVMPVGGPSARDLILAALGRVQSTLDKHRKKYG